MEHGGGSVGLSGPFGSAQDTAELFPYQSYLRIRRSRLEEAAALDDARAGSESVTMVSLITWLSIAEQIFRLV